MAGAVVLAVDAAPVPWDAPGAPYSPMFYAAEDVEIVAGPELTSADLVSNESELPCAGVTVDLDETGLVVVAWDGTEPSCPIRLIEVTIVGHHFAGLDLQFDRLLGVPVPDEEPILDPGEPEPEAPAVSDLSVFVGDFATRMTWTARLGDDRAFLVDEAFFRFDLRQDPADPADPGGPTDPGEPAGPTDPTDPAGPGTPGDTTPPSAAPATAATATPTYTG